MSAFKRMAIRDEMPLRPGYGTLGKPQVLRANFFAVRVTKRIIYDYEVAFTPAAQARRERKARILQILENHPQFAPYANQVAHDRSQRLVSVVKLPQPLSIQVQYIEEGETVPQNNALVFTVDIKFIRELDNNGMNKCVILHSYLCGVYLIHYLGTWMATIKTTTLSPLYQL